MKAIGVAAWVLLLVTSAAQADPRDDALSAVLRCSGVGDKAQRLVCYDSAVVRVPGALNAAQPQAQSMTGAVPPPAAPVTARPQRQSSWLSNILGPGGPSRRPQTTVAQFGSESIASGGREASPLPMDDDTIDQISARVIGYSFDSGYLSVTLDNGQVWKQTAGAGSPVSHLSKPPLAYDAVISRGSAGSYDMHLSGYARTIAVRRIR
jgi:hypothetical protein